MTSPMGWNSWDCYGAAVNEKTVRKNAEYMADKLKKYGWEYVVVDIQWYEPTAQSHEYHPFTELCMNEYGQLMPAENRFPSAKGGKGFAYAYTYPGLNKVLQAAGRLMRTERDHGVVLLLDDRFLDDELREAFPQEWRGVRTCTLKTLPGLLARLPPGQR